MKIAIVSDTHGNVANFKKLIKWLNEQDIIVLFHAGDIGSVESLKESLEEFKGEMFGVLGNMDSKYRDRLGDYNRLKNVFIEEEVFEKEIDEKKIAVTHLPQRAKELAKSGKYDLIFYGHTHTPWEWKEENCQLINPGELAGQIFKPTFAVYDTKTGGLELKLLEKLN